MTFCIVIYIYIIYIFFITQIHNYSRNTFFFTVLDSTCVGLRVILCVLPSISLFISVFIKYHNFWAKLRYINIFRKNYLKHVVKNNYIIKPFSPHNILDISHSEQGWVGACGSYLSTATLYCAILCPFSLTGMNPLHSGEGFDTKWPPVRRRHHLAKAKRRTAEDVVLLWVKHQMLYGREAGTLSRDVLKTRVASETKTENQALRSGLAWVLKGWDKQKASGLGDPADVVLLGCLQFLRVWLASLLRFPAKANNNQPPIYLQTTSPSADTFSNYVSMHAWD